MVKSMVYGGYEYIEGGSATNIPGLTLRETEGVVSFQDFDGIFVCTNIQVRLKPGV